MLKDALRVNYQRSNYIPLATTLAKQAVPSGAVGISGKKLLDENGVIALTTTRWCRYAGIHIFPEEQIQSKTEAEALFRRPSFSRFRWCG
jgi:hypothetical protein